MFERLGKFVSRYWWLLLIGWIGLLVFLKLTAPPLNSVVRDGEFTFLPPDAPSRVGERLYQQAWGHPVASTVVIVVRRENGTNGLTEADKAFVEDVLKPRLEKVVEEAMKKVGLISDKPNNAESSSASKPSSEKTEHRSSVPNSNNKKKEGELKLPPEPRVRTFTDKSIGRLLISEDNKATLVMVELPTDFMDARNAEIIRRVEELTGPEGELHKQRLVPPGLQLDLSGSATVGWDMIHAAKESADATELWTILLVVILLVIIYRSPLLALIPLLTVFVAVKTALALMAWMAWLGWIELFRGIEIYTTVLAYGAGVDYCLFLTARYKEELDEGCEIGEAVGNALAKVGAALTASAGTVICGIGMMSFAEFGKFRHAGQAISMGLFVVLIAALLFAPSLLGLVGRWAFWPYVATDRLSRTAGWISATNPLARLFNHDWTQTLWDRTAVVVKEKPGKIFLLTVGLMLPFAVVAVFLFRHLTYGLLSELPRDFASVQGAQAVQQHFPAGITGPITILLKHPELDFASKEGTKLIEQLTDRLAAFKDELHLADVRSLSKPLGLKFKAEAASEDQHAPLAARLIAERIRRQRIRQYYVSTKGELKGKVTRLDVVLRDDPFTRNSINQFERLVETVQHLLHKELNHPEIEVYAIGPPADIRDLKVVTDRDEIRIDSLVLLVVFLILVALLRRVGISLYLIVSVFYSYLTTLGVTFVVFWALDPSNFAGLDWKVPMFLFTILIAVGEDYNIFLMARIDEEQREHGPVDGIVEALRKTGAIISSCGIIMAGTFSSLIAGSLRGMDQLGFALAFGVLLDTFVVRPILVPAFLLLLHTGRLGTIGKWLGARLEHEHHNQNSN